MSLSRAHLLGAVGACAVSVAFVLVGYTLLRHPESPLRSRLRRHLARRRSQLAFLGARTSPSRFMLVQAGGMAASPVACLLVEHPAPAALLPVVVLAPDPILERMRSRRITRLEQQLDAWLTMLANALQVTPSLGEALSTSARLVPAPLRDELQLMIRIYELGTPLDDAMAEASRRIGSRVFSVALLILRVGRHAGGDMPRTLEQAAASLRELARLEGVLRAKTAEARSQATVIGVVPFVLVALLSWLNPQLLRPLPETAPGHVIIGIAVALWISALISARRILSVEL